MKIQNIPYQHLQSSSAPQNRVRLTQSVSVRTTQDLVAQGFVPEAVGREGRWNKTPHIAPIPRTGQAVVASYAVIDSLTSPNRVHNEPGWLIDQDA